MHQEQDKNKRSYATVKPTTNELIKPSDENLKAKDDTAIAVWMKDQTPLDLPVWVSKKMELER